MQRKKRNIPLQEDSESQSKRQNHPHESSENHKIGVVCWDGRTGKGRQLVPLVGDRNPSSEVLPKGKRGRSKRIIRRGAVEKGRSVRVMEGKKSEETTQSNTCSPQGQKYL